MKCSACRNTWAVERDSCPVCGSDVPRPSRSRYVWELLWVLMGVAVILLVAGR
jgi:hypothetical protein